MNSKTLGILAIISLVLLVVAIIAYGTRDTSEPTAGRELLYADLGDRLNDVAAVVVRAQAGSFRIERRDDVWRLVEKGGYPAEFEKVKSAIVGLSKAEIVEPKTKKTELHAKLGLDGPDAPESTSTLIGLEDASGASIASLIVGQQSSDPGGDRWFVRKDGDDQAWLVKGGLQIDADPMTWLERSVVGVPRDRMQRIEITAPDGETLFVFRDAVEQTNFTVSDVPPDRELTFPGAAASITSGLAFLRIEDVTSVDERPLDPDDTTVAEFRTFDGLVLTARTDEIDDQVWATFDVGVDESLVAATEEATSDGVDDPSTPEDERDVRAVAESLRAKLDGWVYRLGDTQADNLRKRMVDLTREKPEPEPEPEDVDSSGAASEASPPSDPPGSPNG